MEKDPDSTLPNEQAFQKNVGQLQLAFGATHQGWFEINLRTGQAVVNEQYAIMLGYSPAGFQESLDAWYLRVHPEDLLTVRAVYRDYALGKRADYLVEFRERTRTGEWIWILSVAAFVAFDNEGKPLRLAGTRLDISARKQAEAAAVAGELRYRLLLEHSMDAILQSEADGRIISANPAACALFRATESELMQSRCDDFLDVSDHRLTAISTTRIETGQARGEVWMRRLDGTRFEAEIATALYTDRDGTVITSLFVQDITARKKAAAEINWLAYFDQLTGLPNRSWLMAHLDTACREARAGGRVDALLFLDMDRFKHVNDVRGHGGGDTLLKCVADRIRTTLGTRGTAGRLGGDEFVIHIAGVGDSFADGGTTALAIAHEISLAIQAPVALDGQPYRETVSIGVTLFPKADETANDLLREADTAMYRAKGAGRNQVILFEPAMQAELERQLGLKRDLALALHHDELQLHCQPQVDRSGQLVGAELLLRWTQPERGQVSPAVFIPLAEESDLIVRIGCWVINAACALEVATRRRGLAVPLSINISPRQFRHPDFVAQVHHAIASTGANASRLVFEVTEGLFIEDMAEVVERMTTLGALGIRFSIDDFGTGYSSLAYLKQLPLHELKIDRRFVQGLPADRDDVAIVQSMLSIARHLDLRVVAEGVETAAQADFLSNAGCDCLQGYLFGRPAPLGQLLLMNG